MRMIIVRVRMTVAMFMLMRMMVMMSVRVGVVVRMSVVAHEQFLVSATSHISASRGADAALCYSSTHPPCVPTIGDAAGASARATLLRESAASVRHSIRGGLNACL